jgi:hypothetical protein
MNTSMKFKIIANNIALFFPPSETYFLLDNEQLVKVLNYNTKWYYKSSIYPYYINTYANLDKVNLLEFLFGLKNNIKFVNTYLDYYDLRETNIIIETQKHNYDDIISKKYNVIEYIQGHIKLDKIVNPVWKIQDNDVYYLMYCHKDHIVKLTQSQYNELKQYESTLDFKISWTFAFVKQPNIIANHNNNKIKLHRIIKSFNYKSLITIDNITKQNIPIENITQDILIENTTHDILIEDTFNESILEETDIGTSKLSHHDITVKNKYNVVKTIKGHVKNMGSTTGKEKNRMWKIEDFDTQYILMYCEVNTFVKLCKESYIKILNFEKKHNNSKKITWYKLQNGYILGSFENKKQLYMHQVIMNYYGHGKGTGNKTSNEHSIDHIDRDPTNNMMKNLRLATRDEQEQNSKGIMSDSKRARKHNAQPLPDGFTQDMMPKYVTYYNECYNKDKGLYREFLKIEKHPMLDKIWTSSKSNKVTLLDKLKSAKDVLNKLGIVI